MKTSSTIPKEPTNTIDTWNYSITKNKETIPITQSQKKKKPEKKKKETVMAYGTWDSRVIPHPSTNQAYERLSSEFGMGSPACATSMAVYIN